MAKFSVRRNITEKIPEAEPTRNEAMPPLQFEPSPQEGSSYFEKLEELSKTGRIAVEIAEPSTIKTDLEFSPNRTVMKMFTLVPNLEENFTFKTIPFGGEDYVQAIRMVLARTRKKAQKNGIVLKEFKLFLVSIENCGTHDLVTVVRSARASLAQKTAYDEIIQTLRTDGEKE